MLKYIINNFIVKALPYKMALSTQRKKEQCEVLSVTLLLRWHGEDGTAINTCMYTKKTKPD